MDVVALDSAHGHNDGVIKAVSKVKAAYPSLQVIAGNVATAEGAKALIGNSTLNGYPSTWNPAEKDIKTMRPQSGDGRTPTKRKKNRLPGTVITAWRKEKPYD